MPLLSIDIHLLHSGQHQAQLLKPLLHRTLELWVFCVIGPDGVDALLLNLHAELLIVLEILPVIVNGRSRRNAITAMDLTWLKLP